MRKLAAAFLIAFLAHPAPIFAWGGPGHSLVARIAEAQFTVAVRARVAAILGPERPMRSVASWADDVRRTRPQTAGWHFINIPMTAQHLEMSRDCASGDCVIAKILDFRKILKDPATAPEARAEALMFLVHFIGDMHQPLHCGDKNDRGGNDIRVKLADRDTNLHSVWDSGILARMGTEDQLFPGLAAESAKRAKKWSKGTVEEWAQESYVKAKSKVYGKLPPAAPGALAVIDAKYEKMANPIIREQLEKAGARLARVLNETLQ